MRMEHLITAVAALCALLSQPACSSSDAPASPSGADAGQDAASDAGPQDASAEQQASDASADANAQADADAGVTSVDQMIPAAAEAICGALFRCCDSASMQDYFAAATSNAALATFQNKVPPAATIDAAGCRDVVAQMLAIVPFGGWLENVSAGRVSFQASGANECLNELAGADCGRAVGTALDDGTCFGFAPAVNAMDQRRMFHRIGNPGAACVPIPADGFGAAFYGTCDPAKAFCCIDDPNNASGGCGLPADGLTGTCQAAGAAGDACAIDVPLKLCAAGAICDSSAGTCVAESTQPLSVGEPCVDANYNLLGICQDSWCDLIASQVCESLEADGSACYDSSECESGHCDEPGPSGKCAPWSFCAAP